MQQCSSHLDRLSSWGITGTHSLGLTGTGTHWDSRFGRRSLGPTGTHSLTHPSTGNGGRGQARWRDLRRRSVGRSIEREKGYGGGGGHGIYTLGWEGGWRWKDKGGFGQFHCFGSCLSGGKGIVWLSMGVGGCWGQRAWDNKTVDRAGSRHVESWSWTEPIFHNVPCCQRHGKT